MSLVLYHVSEDGGIDRFVPRPPPSTAPGIPDDVVWAVDDVHLPNYLLPRDCPRVTFRSGTSTTAEDRKAFGGEAATLGVVAVEARWLDRIAACRLFLYRLPTKTFRVSDAIAGYHVSRLAVVPTAVTALTDLVGALRERHVELRVLEDLWHLHDAVIASSLEYSIIRMRNAAPRHATAKP